MKLFDLKLVALLAGTFVIAMASTGHAQNLRDVILNNTSGDIIDEVHISPSSSPNPGGNLLGPDVLLDGQAMYVNVQGYRACHFDVGVVFEDNPPRFYSDIDFCQVSKITITDNSEYIE